MILIELAAQYITAGDIALYGALCGLACFDRGGLKRLVIDNTNVRPLLELEPHLKDVVSHFYGSNYKAALELLARYHVSVPVSVRVECLDVSHSPATPSMSTSPTTLTSFSVRSAPAPLSSTLRLFRPPRFLAWPPPLAGPRRRCRPRSSGSSGPRTSKRASTRVTRCVGP